MAFQYSYCLESPTRYAYAELADPTLVDGAVLLPDNGDLHDLTSWQGVATFNGVPIPDPSNLAMEIWALCLFRSTTPVGSWNAASAYRVADWAPYKAMARNQNVVGSIGSPADLLNAMPTLSLPWGLYFAAIDARVAPNSMAGMPSYYTDYPNAQYRSACGLLDLVKPAGGGWISNQWNDFSLDGGAGELGEERLEQTASARPLTESGCEDRSSARLGTPYNFLHDLCLDAKHVVRFRVNRRGWSS